METMLVRFRTFAAALAAGAFISGSALVTSPGAFAQGPFTPHEGLTITRAYTSQYGPDAEEFNVIRSVNPDGVLIDYNDTRGIAAQRLVRSVEASEAEPPALNSTFEPKLPVRFSVP